MRVGRRGLERVGSWAFIALVIATLLSACSTGDDEGDTPAPSNAAATATTGAGQPTSTTGALPPADLTDINGQLISDGLCQALIPDGWVDDGTGRGTTASGGRFVLFGGRVSSDADWERSVEIVSTPAAGGAIGSIEREDDSIYVTYTGDLGFEVRRRFGSQYCDLTVSSSTKPIPEGERAFWPAIIESLRPVEAPSE